MEKYTYEELPPAADVEADELDVEPAENISTHGNPTVWYTLALGFEPRQEESAAKP